MRRIMTLQPYDIKKLSTELAGAAGNMKLFVGANNNAAIVYMRDAMDAIKKSCYYRGRAKQLFRYAMNEVVLYNSRLITPPAGELKLFDVDTFEPEFKKNYKDGITNQEYFDFWEGVGCELYNRTIKFISSAEWKLHKHFTRLGYKEPGVLAKGMMADNLLNMSRQSFDSLGDNCEKNLPATEPRFKRMVYALDITPVFAKWNMAMQTIVATKGDLTSEETHDLELSMLQIAEMWADPELIHSIQMDMMGEFKDELYASNRQYNTIMKRQAAIHRELEEEVEKVKKDNIINKYKN